MSPELLVEAHGSFGSSTCTLCGTQYSQEYFKTKVTDMTDRMTDSMEKLIPWCKCDKCHGNVKPDIVFFGEGIAVLYEPNFSTRFLLICFYI